MLSSLVRGVVVGIGVYTSIMMLGGALGASIRYASRRDLTATDVVVVAMATPYAGLSFVMNHVCRTPLYAVFVYDNQRSAVLVDGSSAPSITASFA